MRQASYQHVKTWIFDVDASYECQKILRFAVTSPFTQGNVVSNDTATLCRVDAHNQSYTRARQRLFALTLHTVSGGHTRSNLHRTANLQHTSLKRCVMEGRCVPTNPSLDWWAVVHEDQPTQPRNIPRPINPILNNERGSALLDHDRIIFFPLRDCWLVLSRSRAAVVVGDTVWACFPVIRISRPPSSSHRFFFSHVWPQQFGNGGDGYVATCGQKSGLGCVFGYGIQRWNCSTDWFKVGRTWWLHTTCAASGDLFWCRTCIVREELRFFVAFTVFELRCSGGISAVTYATVVRLIIFMHCKCIKVAFDELHFAMALRWPWTLLQPWTHDLQVVRQKDTSHQDPCDLDTCSCMCPRARHRQLLSRRRAKKTSGSCRMR
jgi:hypothetical protein